MWCHVLNGSIPVAPVVVVGVVLNLVHLFLEDFVDAQFDGSNVV